MIRRTLAISVFALAMLVAPAAQASTTFGFDADPYIGFSTCGTESFCNYAVGGSAGAASAAGVVTSVRVGMKGHYSHGTLRVLRDTGLLGTYLNVTAQPILIPDIGTNPRTITYPTRFPVIPGDRIGVGWVSITSFASIQMKSASLGEGINANGELIEHPVGTSQLYGNSGNPPAIAAVLEADVDGDGFGDETQDACPTNATIQASCPRPAAPAVSLLKPGTLKFSKLAVTHSVTTASTVASIATVKIGKKSYKSARVKKSLAAGSAAIFKFSFGSSAKKAIAKYLTSHKSIKTTINATVSNADGNSTSSLTVKLTK